ncbi:hypothetical protein [Roseibium sp.]|uniref:hypothetical protein n=1 Tax=Roseibium sp. TaxID=1936156 RepID=UPI003A97733D
MRRNLEIILAGPAQGRQVIDFAKEACRELGHEFGDPQRDSLRQLLVDAAAGRIYMPFYKGIPAGIVVVVFRLSIASGGRGAVIDHLYLAPRFRELGLESRTLKAVVRDLEAFGLLEVCFFSAGAGRHDQLLIEEGFELRTGQFFCRPLIRDSEEL